MWRLNDPATVLIAAELLLQVQVRLEAERLLKSHDATDTGYAARVCRWP